MKEKRCIFHIPNYIDKTSKSGSSVRPQMMIKAFEEIGYHVDYVMGYGKERKSQIEKIKQNIRNGVKYEFLYAENSTTPTLLTEKNHIPKYPFLDFGFFKFCKKYGIKIGLFYRDVYWKFPLYKQGVSFGKRMVTLPMFYYDLKKYKRYVDILYLPSKRMKKYVDIPIICKELPPGCATRTLNEEGHCKEKVNQELNIFYVGGISGLYNLTKLFKVVKELPFVKLVVCCRENEWKEHKAGYSRYLNDRVEIIHKSGEELEKYYAETDICSLFFESEEYRSFAMPIKLFEYLGHKKPVIATENTAAGEFVRENAVGWEVPYSEEDLRNLLKEINDNKQTLEKMENNICNTLEKNTWKARAYQVEKDLSSKNNY